MNETSILQGLNDAQRQAVTAEFKPLLVIAGAGSGKTRILTRRIAYLISQNVPSFHLLGITFTNKAAGEMRKRVDALVKQFVWVSTFHSTCMQILRHDGEVIGLKRHFSIYDETDQLVLIKECMKELSINDRQVNPKAIREIIQRAKDQLTDPVQFQLSAHDYFEEMVSKAYQLYEQKLSFMNGCDFGDLILKVVRLFEKDNVVLERWQDRFRHVLIDEYQDTNHAQYRLIQLIASRYRQLTVVGDPDQSIYAWRGADIKNILRFEEDYPDCQILKLEQNYRSTKVILEAANHLIQHNYQRKPKQLWTENDEGEQIALYEASDEKDEAGYVVKKIKEYQRQGFPLTDMVIFYRVHSQSRVLEDELRRHKINYKIVGGIRFYDRREIKDLVAYLKFIASPDDEVSLKRILNVPSRGVGKKAFEAIAEYAAQHQKTLGSALGGIEQVTGVSSKSKKAIRIFYELITWLRANHAHLNITELLEKILHETGYLNELEGEKTMESRVRIENIKEFFSAVQEFEETWEPFLDELPSHAQPAPSTSMLQNFLESISLQSDIDRWSQDSEQLTLMTLHSAKGLEFPIVFMAGLEEEIFPHVNALGEADGELEEERRLCYVGMTRAKRKLHMTYANSRRLYGFRNHNLPSRFLNEIPQNSFEAPDRFDFRVELDEFDDFDELDDPKRRILYD